MHLTGMEPPELAARLRYLNESAHLLATTSSTTSRYLMSRHNALMYDWKMELSEAQKKKACGSCGTIMILGWGATLESSVQNTKDKTRAKRKVRKQPRAMVYSCGTCSKTTRFPMSISKPSRRNKSVLHATSTLTAPAPVPQSQTSDANTPSKKAPRRKSRKKGVLDAILARSQAPQATSSGFGLDLNDFMKKS
ncbi:hypothetical protein BKA65DRAFT_31700 [Rhexocercosporidium sp. MPI-PUGE-AT-0058]|nr:hypothetical protein BKA65DRAFT_31700 [Rhexocercosporidium sp. MPI-PUGE-AT-0058]